MGLINLFCIKFFLINNSIFLRLKPLRSASLYPYKLAPVAILIPFAAAIDILIPVKLPGPILIKTEKFLSILTFFP